MKKLLHWIMSATMAALLVGCDGQPLELESVSGDQPLLNKWPADGNGNKFVFVFDFFDDPVTCINGETLTKHFGGWGQFKLFGPPNNRNIELHIFHLKVTFTNTAGDTWFWRDVGPDRFYEDKNGHLFVTITGRSTASGNPNRNEIVVGHVVLNLTTNEVVFVAGNEFGPVGDLACAALM